MNENEQHHDDADREGSQPAKPVRLSLRMEEIPIEIEDEKGNVVVFKLCQPDGLERDKYLQGQKNRIDKKTGMMKDFSGHMTDLIAKCLYGPDGQRVSAKMMDRWPAAVTSYLYREASRLMGLGREAEEDAKNS